MTDETAPEAARQAPPAREPDVQAMRTAQPDGAAPKRSFAVSAVSGFLWLGLLAAGAVSLAPMAQGVVQEFERHSLVHAEDGDVRGQLAARTPASDPASLEALSELSLIVNPDEPQKALDLARRAVAKDQRRPFVWARIAWLEAEVARTVNAASLDALRQSMALCLLCDEDLIRWRFNFVLGRWNAMPEDLRRKAFEQADILRWRGENAEFLAEMRVKALQAGIPFDAYRSAVSTPVRSWDIGPARTASR